MQQVARSTLYIDAAAIRGNWLAFAGAVAEGVGVMPVVKANAYGHGLLEVCRALRPLAEKIPGFVVDQLAEGRVVREYFPHHPIFCLGWTPPELVEEVVALGITQTVTSVEDVTPLVAAARGTNQRVKVNIEVETGLHRLGAGERGQEALHAAIVQASDVLEVQGISSHFAEAEAFPGRGFTDEQNAVFYDAIQRGKTLPPFRHIGCTASTIVNPAADHTHVRLGIGLYGLWPSEEVKREGTLGKRHVVLQPALTWTARLAQVQEVPRGETVGYGRSYVANRVVRVGVLPVGYADGLDRRLTGQAVLVKGARCPIIGKICMNMCMIDLSAAPQNVQKGESVTIIGREGMSAVTVDDWARTLGTIHYEIVARISPLLPRTLLNDV